MVLIVVWGGFRVPVSGALFSPGNPVFSGVAAFNSLVFSLSGFLSFGFSFSGGAAPLE